MNHWIRICLLIVFLASVSAAQAQIVSVGWDDDCDYDVRSDADAINTALTDGNSEIRVTNQDTYFNHVRITDSVIVEGGFADCIAASAGDPVVGLTAIDGTSILPSAMKIYSDGDIVSVAVSGFHIKKATGSQDGGPDVNVAAGLVIIHTAGTVDITNFLVDDNHSEFWSGGLAIRNDLSAPGIQNLEVNLNDVIITNNSGGSSGGGLTCYEGNSSVNLNISGQSGISFNHSEVHGGGLFIDECIVDLSFGTNDPGVADPRGIHGNTADGFGGGMALVNGGSVSVSGTQVEPFNITSNQANLDGAGSGDGGGFYLSGTGTNLVMSRVRISDNSTDDNGGGGYLQFESQAVMENENRGCDWSDSCGEFSNNRASNGGAFYMEGATFMKLTGFEAFGNRANGGVFLSVRDDDTRARMESALIHHNGDVDHSEFNDFYLIRNFGGDAQFEIHFSTIVDNDVQEATLAGYSGTSGWLTLVYSIVDDPGIPPSDFVPEGVNGTVNCDIVNDEFNLLNIPNLDVFVESPQFIDRPGQDYHLSGPPNTAIDACQVSVGITPSPDVDGEVRGFDLNGVPNDEEGFDIGHDEYYPGTELPFFASGFE